MFKIGDVVLVTYNIGKYKVKKVPVVIKGIQNSDYKFKGPTKAQGNPFADNEGVGDDWLLSEASPGYTKEQYCLEKYVPQEGEKVVIIKEMISYGDYKIQLPSTVGKIAIVQKTDANSVKLKIVETQDVWYFHPESCMPYNENIPLQAYENITHGPAVPKKKIRCINA